MSGQQQARKRQTHSAEVRQVYECVLAGASVRSRHVEVAGDRVHLLEKSAGSPVVLLHGTGNSAGFLLAIAERTRGGPRDGDRPARGGAERPDRPPTKTLPRDRGRMAGQPARRPRVGRRRAAWPLRGRAVGAMVRNPLTRAGVMRLVLIGVPGLPKTRCPLPIRLIAIPGMGELLSRLVPPCPKSVLRFARFVGEKATLAAHPDLVDLMVATGPGPDRRRKRQGRDTRVGLAVRLAVAFWVPASFQRATRRAAPAGNAHAGGMGRTRPARQRFGRPGSDQAHPARATEGAAHRPRAMARAACADCRDGRGLRAVSG